MRRNRVQTDLMTWIGTCAGKHSVADYLIEKESFQLVSLAETQDPSNRLPRVDTTSYLTNINTDRLHFQTLECLLEFVTRHWQERWVMTGRWGESALEALMRRPFFLMVSVDAPVGVRWRRHLARSVDPLLLTASQQLIVTSALGAERMVQRQNHSKSS